MPIRISWDTSQDDAPMIVSHSDGRQTVIPFDDVIEKAVPMIADYMGENERKVFAHFIAGDELQIDDDALMVEVSA